MRPSPRDVLDELADRISKRRVVFFLGAGASWDSPSSLPTSVEILRQLVARAVRPVGRAKKKHLVERIVAGVRFEVFMQLLVSVVGPPALSALKILDGGTPNANHAFMARLLRSRFVPVLLTTNFDGLLERAVTNLTGSPPELWYQPRDYRSARLDGKPKILKLHGTLRDQGGADVHESLAAAASDLGRPLPPDKSRTLKRLLRDFDVVFIGYSGMDDFDLLPLLLATPSKRSIYWVHHQNSSRVICTRSEDLAGSLADNRPCHERIVSSRRRSFLLAGQTSSIVGELQKRLYPGSSAFPASTRRPHSFGYLHKWAKDVGLSNAKHLLTGLLLLRLEDYQLALKHFEAALSADPNNHLALLGRATSLRRGGKANAARQALVKALGAATSPRHRHRTLVELGLLESEQSNYSEARRRLRAVLRSSSLTPGTGVDVHNNFAVTLLFEAERLRLANTSE